MALLTDLRYAIRLFGRQRGSALLIVITLALGVGGTSAMFSMVYGVLLRPLPYAAPEQIVRIVWPQDSERRSTATSPADYLDFKKDNVAFSAVAGYISMAADVSTGRGFPERIKGAQVTELFFDVFGVSPARGRSFGEATADRERGTVAVLSYGLWQRRFGGREDAIGQKLMVNGHPQTIVGVMPSSFGWPDGDTQVWTLAPQAVPDCPIAFTGELLAQRDVDYFNTIGRLRGDVAIGAAQSNADSIAAQLRTRHTESNRNRRIELVSLKESIIGDSRPALLVLFGAVGLVLLIACANVANLLLAQASDRHREMAVRTALGAPRGRLVRQLLAESLVLAAIGGGLGLLVAQWGVTAALALAPKDIPRLTEVQVDWSVLAFTTIVCLITGVLFGLAPALQSSRVTPQDVLRDASARTAGASGAHRTRALLVISQVALALILVSGASLMITSFTRLQAVDPGFKTEHVVSAALVLPSTRYAKQAQQYQFYQRVLERIQTSPFTSSATIAFPMPLQAENANATFQIDGRLTAPGQPEPLTAVASVAPGYFRTLSVPIIRGRDVTTQDTESAPPVAIVNTAFVRKYFAEQDPIGKRILFGGSDANASTIVGIVGDIKGHGLAQAAPPTLYFPYEQFTVPYSSLIVRTAATPGDVATALREIVKQLDPDLPVDDVKPLNAIVGESIAQPRFRTMLLSAFAGSALLLALVGVYGVISYTVAQRRRELGVRAAMGATPMDLLRLVMKQGLVLAAIGVAVGLLGTFALSGLLKGLLYGIGATDPFTLAIATLTLLVVAALASVVPARRAMRQDPLMALRNE